MVKGGGLRGGENGELREGEGRTAAANRTRYNSYAHNCQKIHYTIKYKDTVALISEPGILTM